MGTVNISIIYANLNNTAQGDGRLEARPPVQEEAEDTYAYDPVTPVPTRGGAMLGDRSGILPQNEIESRQDVLVYTTSTLIESIEVTGPLRAVLYVRTDAPSTDFTVKLVDVHSDGTAYNVSDGILRRNYRFSAKNQVSSPEEIEVELGPTSHVFLSGHRIRVEVSSSNFPRFDRNPNTGDGSTDAIQFRVAHQAVIHSPLWASRVVLPVIPR
jgi:putative CocE/NonD family hydrolase